MRRGIGGTVRLGDLPAKARKQLEATHGKGVVTEPRYKAAQIHRNATVRALLGSMDVEGVKTKRKLPRPLPTAEERFDVQLRADPRPGLESPAREHRFHEERRWRFDFAWPHLRIALEIEGVTKDGGRHQRPKGFTEDCRKYNAAQLAGWIVLRYTPAQVKSGEALAGVHEAWRYRAWADRQRTEVQGNVVVLAEGLQLVASNGEPIPMVTVTAGTASRGTAR